MSLLHRATLFWHTTRYLSPTQIAYRARRIARKRWWRLRQTQIALSAHAPMRDYQSIYVGLAHVAAQESDGLSELLSEARAVAANCFEFLNHRAEFAVDVEWHSADLSQLFRYNLNYFHYVLPLLVQHHHDPNSDAEATFVRLAQSWITHNQMLQGDGWHPYTISLRVVNWLYALAEFSAETIPPSLYAQLRFLASDLEKDVRGNHLFENIRALIHGGIAFEGKEPQRWLEMGLRLLKTELHEQVLADGGHFERSPSYHLVILRDCIEIGLWLRRNNRAVPAHLDDAIERMLDNLVAILRPDGNVPLLKDSAWDAALPPADLLAAGALYLDQPRFKHNATLGIYPQLLFDAKGVTQFENWPLNDDPPATTALQQSGHYVCRDSRLFGVVDAGIVCPSYLPAHAHADMLTYELHIDGAPIVVDSGVYEYPAGAWRDYFRSTRAHNTVAVAAQNQSEVWGSFRVARRATPTIHRWETCADRATLIASHDGYMRLVTPTVHKRMVVWQREAFWLVVDWLSQPVSAENFIHLHPDSQLTQHADSQWQINTDIWLTLLPLGTMRIVQGQEQPKQGWYSERFGEIRPNPVLCWQQSAAHQFAYVISLDAPAQLTIADDAAIVEYQNTRHEFSTL